MQTLNLRSFGVGTSLVLVNGRRLANYPAAYQSETTVFNYGAIPAAAVERIEVLSTGASAIYGSDAVAGVINIILRDDLDGISANLLYGTATEASGSADDTRIQLLMGKLFERGSITAAVEYQDLDSILAGQFNEYDSDLDYPYGTGYQARANLNLNIWNIFRGEAAYDDPGQETCDAIGPVNGTAYAFRPGSGNYCGYDQAAETNLRNAREHYSVFVNAQFDVTDNLNVFADVLYYGSESESNSWGIYIFEEMLDLNTIVDTGIIGPFFDYYLAQRAFTEQELGRSLNETYEDDALTVTIGATGYFRDTHEWELTYTHSEYELSSARPWWKADSVVDLFLGTWYGEGFNFFTTNWWSGQGVPCGLARDASLYEPCDAALLNDAIGNQVYGNETKSQLAQFTMNGDLREMKYGPLSYAVVLEFENQDFAMIPDERVKQDPVEPFTIGSGWYNLTGYRGEGDRERSALGVELRVPLHDTFTLNVAARVDDYDSKSSSIGTKTTPSATFEWRPVENFLLRGGYMGSFRAPDLHYVYTETGFFTTRTDIVSCWEDHVLGGGTLDGFSPSACGAAYRFSPFVERIPAIREDDLIEPLKDETGFSRWVGFSVEPVEDLSIQVDLSQIRLKNRVELESLQELLDDEWACLPEVGFITGDRCDYVARRIDRQPSAFGSFIDNFNASPINTAVEEITSLDVVMNYRRDTSIGDFGFRGEYTHTLDHTKKDDPDSSEIDLRDDPILGGWDFRSIVGGTMSYQRNKFSTALSFVRRGSTTIFWANAVGTQRYLDGDTRIGPYITWNLTAGYEFTDNIDARIRVQNLFDADPPSDPSVSALYFPWYNYFVYPGAGIGRRAAVELNFRFD